MKRANLIGAFRNSDYAATVCEFQLQRSLLSERLGKWEVSLKRFVLLFVESLRVVNQLRRLVFFLGLKEDFALIIRHG